MAIKFEAQKTQQRAQKDLRIARGQELSVAKQERRRARLARLFTFRSQSKVYATERLQEAKERVKAVRQIRRRNLVSSSQEKYTEQSYTNYARVTTINGKDFSLEHTLQHYPHRGMTSAEGKIDRKTLSEYKAKEIYKRFIEPLRSIENRMERLEIDRQHKKARRAEFRAQPAKFIAKEWVWPAVKATGAAVGYVIGEVLMHAPYIIGTALLLAVIVAL